MKYDLLFARFPFGAQENPDVTDWLIQTALKVKRDPRIREIHNVRKDDTPITMSRNLVVKRAQQLGVDYLVMIDSDMGPDYLVGEDPLAKPFWESSFNFALAHNGPCVVASPYCGPPPHENIYIFQWAKKQSDHPNMDFKLEQFSREEAARWQGIVEVGALPTGLILIDMKCFEALKPPYFDYEWADPPFNTEKSTTEDVFFTRNLSLAGVPVYVNWDSWSRHHKRKAVGKPALVTVDGIRDELREAVLRNHSVRERLTIVGGGNGHKVSMGKVLADQGGKMVEKIEMVGPPRLPLARSKKK